MKEIKESDKIQFKTGFFNLTITMDGEVKIKFIKETIKTSLLVDIDLSSKAPISLPSNKREAGFSELIDISSEGDKKLMLEIMELIQPLFSFFIGFTSYNTSLNRDQISLTVLMAKNGELLIQRVF